MESMPRAPRAPRVPGAPRVRLRAHAKTHKSADIARAQIARGGGGTGSYPFEAASGIYNELQCGSYVFMDADYGRVRDAAGAPLGEFESSLFVLTAVVSAARPGRAVCDAGLKAHSLDSGPPLVHGRGELSYREASDEHGTIDDPGDSLRLDDKLLLVPGHCDPTVNLHDCYVCVRGLGTRDGRVEALWPVTARGRSA